MNKQYKKIDGNSAEVTFTEVVTRKEQVSLPTLIYERDSMIRTIAANDLENFQRNEKIKIHLKEVEEEIALLTNLGIRAQVVNPEIIVEEKVEEVVVEEEKVEEQKIEEVVVEEEKAIESEQPVANDIVVEDINGKVIPPKKGKEKKVK